MVNVYFVRHGETQFNVKQLVQGWCDSMLTAKGEQQADAVGERLAAVTFKAAFSGGLGRQRETARRILAKNRGQTIPPLQEDAGFREVCFGDYEGEPFEKMLGAAYAAAGLPYGNVNQLFQKYTPATLTDLTAALDKTGTAETTQAAKARLIAAAARAAASVPDGGNVLVVSSGAALGILLPAMGWTAPKAGYIQNGDITVMSYDALTKRWRAVPENI